jgi:hypothetical protein
MIPLYCAYIANIVILVPIAIPTLFRLFATDENRFAESAGWRIIVGSFWLSILILSALGLFEPLRFSPVLLVQLIYKLSWLMVYAVPQIRNGHLQTLPRGITVSFVLIVMIWPWVIPWSYLFG